MSLKSDEKDEHEGKLQWQVGSRDKLSNIDEQNALCSREALAQLTF